jgi:thiol:disulfide interchange protein
MGRTLGGVAIGFLVLAAVLWPLERLHPAVPGQPLWRRGLTTDLAYWFFTPLLTRSITRAGVEMAVVLLALLAGVPLDKTHIEALGGTRRPADGCDGAEAAQGFGSLLGVPS